MNILITGIHGFVGSNLVKAFKNKAQHLEFGYYSTNKRRRCKDLWLERVSILDAFPPIDAVIHSRNLDVEILHC